MKVVVAVETDLSPIANALRDQGYEVIDIEGDLSQAKAVVISGSDDNLMGRQDILTEAPVINAEGRTAEDVVRAVNEKVRLQRR